MVLLAALGLALSVKSVPYTWRNVQIVGGGFVSGIITHPTARGLIYCRTDIGGAYRWDQKLGKWIPLQDWLTQPDWNLYGAESVAVDPNDPKRIYIAAGTYTMEGIPNGAILRSKDLGKTWNRTDLPFRNGANMDGRGIGERLMVDPSKGSKLYFGTRSAGLWRSDDSGATWKQDQSFPILKSTDGNGIGWIAFDPRKSKLGKRIVIGVASAGTSLYESIDSGSTWHPMAAQPTDYIPSHGTIDQAGNLFVTYGNGVGPNGVSRGAVYRREDKSGDWTDISPIKTSEDEHFGYAGLSLDAKVPGTLIVSTLNRWGKDTIFRSRDNGATWTSIAPNAKMDASFSPFVKYDHKEADFGHWIHDVEIDPFDSDRVWYGTGATIWTTRNFTAADHAKPTQWTIGANGIEETAVIDLMSPKEGASIVSGLGDIGSFVHFDMDHSPKDGVLLNPYLSNVDDLDYAGQRPSHFLRVGRTSREQHGGYSTDGGRTWKPLATDPPASRGSGSAAISADGKTVVWSPSGTDHPFVTTDFGATWQRCVGGQKGQVVSDKVDANTFYLLSDGILKVSRDGGKSFENSCSGLPKGTGRLVPAFHAAGELWLPTTDGLYRSTDFGKLFWRVGDVNSAGQVSLGKAAPGASYPTLYVIGLLEGIPGVFRSTDEGTTWVQINDAKTGLGTMGNIEGDPKTFGRVYIGTNGRGVFVAEPRR